MGRVLRLKKNTHGSPGRSQCGWRGSVGTVLSLELMFERWWRRMLREWYGAKEDTDEISRRKNEAMTSRGVVADFMAF